MIALLHPAERPSQAYMPPTRFGTMLRELRERRGWSQEILAEKVGKSHVAIGDWERGKRNPRRDSVEAVANALETDAADLLIAAGFDPGASAISRDEIMNLHSISIPLTEGEAANLTVPAHVTEEDRELFRGLLESAMRARGYEVKSG